ncbi:hypothetical protein JCM8547_008406 [Rhodosporidiobolus lusitaniae]
MTFQTSSVAGAPSHTTQHDGSSLVGEEPALPQAVSSSTSSSGLLLDPAQGGTGAHAVQPTALSDHSFLPSLSPSAPISTSHLSAEQQQHQQPAHLNLSTLEAFLDSVSSSGTPSYAASDEAFDFAPAPPSPDLVGSLDEPVGLETRYAEYQQHQQLYEHPTHAQEPAEALSFSRPLFAHPSTMPPESSMRDEPITEVPIASTSAGVRERAGPFGRDRDLTVTIPRRRALSPAGAAVDGQRPFAFKRQSSGLSSSWAGLLNYAASPTSDLRTRPSTPAESATRSTFGVDALSQSPPSSSAPLFTASPSATLPPLEIPSAPALQLTGPTPSTALPGDRPKGKGTLELERVLGMWAEKTPTSSFPNLPPLSSSSSAPSSTPLFTQTIVSSEPESFNPQAPRLDSLPSTSSSFFPSFPSQQGAAPAPTFLDDSSRTLVPPRSPPRRQRSKSEADIFRTVFSFGTTADALQPLPADTAARYLPSTFSQSPQQQQQAMMDPVDVWTTPAADPSTFTTATPAFATLNLDSDQHELTTRSRPSQSRPHHTAGGPGYHEAALLEVPGQGRRARSQGAGHRRTAKSDDFTHLFAASPYASLQPQPVFLSSASGHLAPPEPVQHVAAVQPSPSPPADAHPPSSSSYPQPSPSHIQAILPNGTPILVPVGSFLPALPLPPHFAPSPGAAEQYLASSAYPQAYQQQQQQPLPPMHQFSSSLPQTSPHLQQQQYPLSFAAQQAQPPYPSAAPGTGLQFHTCPPAVPSASSLSHHRLSVSSHSGSPHPHDLSRHASPALSTSAPSPGFVWQGQGRTPHVYHSPQMRAGDVLPSPPVSGGGFGAVSSPGGRSGRSSRSRSHSRAAAGGGGGGDEEMSNAEDDEDAEGEVLLEGSAIADEEYEEFEDEEGEGGDESGDYAEDGEEGMGGRGGGGRRRPSASAASSSSKAAAAKKGKKKASPSSSSAAGGGAAGGDFTKESKTTQATIDAAKKRRNSNAVAKFVCELCGETFTRRYNLRGHQRAHRNEKPYKCSYEGCDKAFARAHDCKRHELLHLGVRKYHCSPCKRDFVRLDALHRHHRSDVGQACVKKLQAEGATFDEKGAIQL